MLQVWTTGPSGPRLSPGFLLAGTHDGGDSSNLEQNPSTANNTTPPVSSPIFIQVQVNNRKQHAILDTGSAVTIINYQLLKNIHHRKFVYKQKLHNSANCTSINIIGEIELEVKIQGHKTFILADVTDNLVTDLLLGNDWIAANNVIIDSTQRYIFLIDQHRRIKASTSFITPPEQAIPVLLTQEITLGPHSETYIDVKLPTLTHKINEALFEPAANLYPKRILLSNAILKIENNQSRITIVNANDRQRTLSRNTRVGFVSWSPMSDCYLILSTTSDAEIYNRNDNKLMKPRRNSILKDSSCSTSPQTDRRVRFSDSTCGEQQHQCYMCAQRFISRNDLQQHLRATCYPQDMREKIEELTAHIENEKQRQRLQNILWKHGKLLDTRKPSIIKATIHHAIDTGAHSPVYTPPYRVSYRDEQIQREEIDKLLKQGIIEESTSPWSSPIVLVRKKDGSVRFCIDFRKLNNITTKDAFPIPRIDDIFDHLSQAEYYSTIDFKAGYFQVGLDPKDCPKTAFSTRDQHYQFTVLPQGVTNGPPAFQRIVSQILGPTRWQYSLAYLDDVIIYSQTFDQHLQHLDDILHRLDDANFRLNVNKCQIAKTSIDYLGHHIERSNIRPNAENIRALLDTPKPTTAKDVFRFVKAAEYYRKFIPNFSTIAQPLYKYAPVTKEQRSSKPQSTPIDMVEEECDAFNKLKEILTNDLVLRIPDENLPFKIHTDASKIGIGAVLMQTHRNGDLPIAYISKKFTTTQMNWPATEQECYAIIYAIEKWHKYLDGREFTIETDHKPLLPFNTKQQLNPKCERWRLKLQQYKFNIRYIKGKHNTVADYLSRAPVENASTDVDDYIPIKSQSTQTENHEVMNIVMSVITRNQAKQTKSDERDDGEPTDQPCEKQQEKRNVESMTDHSCAHNEKKKTTNIPDNQITPFTMEELKRLQHEDEKTKHIMNNIHKFNQYCIQDDMLMRKTNPPVPYVPSGRIRSDIMKIYHDTPANGAHFGRNKTTHKIRERYYWPNMISDIRHYVKSCMPCLQNNHRRQKAPGALKPIKPPDGVWQLLTMDFHGPITPATKQGNRYIISLTDVLSKFVITKAVRDCTASTAARFLTEEVILKYGTPKCILTDNGTHFTATMMAELFKRIGVTHLYATPYHPMTNGQIERYNATMDAKIAALSNENRTNWDEQLPFVTFNYNTSIHATTAQIPFTLMYGRSPVLPFDHQTSSIDLAQDDQHGAKVTAYLSALTQQTKQNITRRQQQYKSQYDKHRMDPMIKVDDIVLIKTQQQRNKFDIRHEGPYRVIQKLGTKTFIVQHINQSTNRRQVTSDIMIPLVERRI